MEEGRGRTEGGEMRVGREEYRGKRGRKMDKEGKLQENPDKAGYIMGRRG